MLKQSLNLVDNKLNFASKIQSSISIFSSLNNLRDLIQKKDQQKQKIFKKSIILAENQIQNEKKIYQWRSKTQFPIVKIQKVQIFQKKQQSCKKEYEVNVYISSELKEISQFQNILFNQALYVLKQSLIGFQRLYYRFGFLQIFPSMIRINKNNKCVVWITSDLCSNKKILFQEKQQNSTAQTKMIKKLLNIVQDITLKVSNNLNFFQKLGSINTFHSAISYIEKYSQQQKIMIPQSLVILQHSSKMFQTKKSLLKNSLNLKQCSKKQTEKISFSSKIPSFIRKIKNKDSNQSDQIFIYERTETNKSEKIDLDRSQTNISRNLSSNSLIKQPLQFKKHSLLHKKRSNKQGFDAKAFWEKMKLEQKQRELDSNLLYIQIPEKLMNKTAYLSGQNSPLIPQSPVSPLYSLTSSPYKKDQGQKSIDQDQKFSDYSFTNKNQFKSFKSAQNLFLTVVQTKRNYCNLSKISNNTAINKYSKKQTKLSQMKENLKSISNDSKQNYQNQTLCENQNIKTSQKSDNNQISYSKSIKNFSLISNSQKRQRKISEDIISFSNKKQNKVPSFLNVKKYQSQEYINSDFQNISLENQQEQKQFLRETIMSKNGWKNLTTLGKNELNQSIIEGNEYQVERKHSTVQLLKLGSMGKDLVSSMIYDNQNIQQMNFKYKVQIKNERQKQILKILL